MSFNDNSPDPHARLFEEYVVELRKSKAWAEKWWKDLNKQPQAGEPVKVRWPDGPASHPVVIAVIQKYYRGCGTINRIHRVNVPPNVFLVEWLMEDETDELADFLAGLSYWPIGLDEKDEVI